MTHAQDEIRVGAVRLPWLKEKNGWLLPWGEVVTNPLKTQRLAEELNEKQVAACDTALFAVELRRCP